MAAKAVVPSVISASIVEEINEALAGLDNGRNFINEISAERPVIIYRGIYSIEKIGAIRFCCTTQSK